MDTALAWLDPPRMAPVRYAGGPPGAVPGGAPRSPAPQLGGPGAVYDGILGRTPADQLVAADLLLGADGRAAMLGPCVPRAAAVARQSAVWVHTGRLQPERMAVVVAPGRRVVARGVTVHRQHLAPGDVVQVGGVPTTTRLRTALDLLCYAPAALAEAGVALLLGTGLSSQAVAAALDAASGVPARRAGALLARVRRSRDAATRARDAAPSTHAPRPPPRTGKGPRV